jgi:mRNA interferase RelE/StbE
MENFRFQLTKEAEEDLERLDSTTRKRILKRLKWFKENFNQISPLPLRGKWYGFFKLRIGKFRIIYEVEKDKNLVTIHYIGKRENIYKKK